MTEVFKVRVVREEGPSPVTGEVYPYEEEELKIEATSPQMAFEISMMISKIKFRGQLRRTFINGEEYFDERH